MPNKSSRDPRRSEIREEADLLGKLALARSGNPDPAWEIVSDIRAGRMEVDGLAGSVLRANRRRAMQILELAIEAGNDELLTEIAREARKQADGGPRDPLARHVLAAYAEVRDAPTFRALKQAMIGRCDVPEDSDLRKVCRSLGLTFKGKSGRPKKGG